jgi:hypothetical protein
MSISFSDDPFKLRSVTAEMKFVIRLRFVQMLQAIDFSLESDIIMVSF